MLSLTLACVGRMKAGPERELAGRYLDRARLTGRALGLDVGLCELAESSARRSADRKVEEARALRSAVAADATLVVFDERGRSLTSDDVAGLLRKALDTGVGLGFAVGGPDGLDPALREAAAHVVALGAMTWPHQLARVMVCEQIYRATTILSGHPYHRV